MSDFGKERMWYSISEFIKNKDARFQMAIHKGCMITEEIGTQVKPDMISVGDGEYPAEHIDEYFTASTVNHEATGNRQHRRRPRRTDDWSAYNRGEGDFDDYHRYYDRGTSYYDRNDHY